MSADKASLWWYTELLRRALAVAPDAVTATEAAEFAFAAIPQLPADEEQAFEESLDIELARGEGRAAGDRWQGPSGRWFTKREDGRTTPINQKGEHDDHRWKRTKPGASGNPLIDEIEKFLSDEPLTTERLKLLAQLLEKFIASQTTQAPAPAPVPAPVRHSAMSLAVPATYRRQELIPTAGVTLAQGEVTYGSEPPGPGWTAAGEMRWQKTHPGDPADSPRIAIVGGGPGGLFTAYLLGQKLPQAQLTILEASSRLGGKIRTDRFSDGTPFEAGVAELYEYLGPGGKDPLRHLIENELGLPSTNMSGGGVILRGEVLRSQDDVEVVHGQTTRENIERFHAKVAELMPLERYANRWQPDNEHPWAKKTFLQYLIEEIPDDRVAREYITTAIRSDLATEPWTCNGLNGLKNALMDNDRYMQLFHVNGGIERLVNELTERIRATVHFGARVTFIGKKRKQYEVSYKKGTQTSSLEVDAVVVALPNHWLSQIDFRDEKMKAAIAKMLAHYDSPAHYLRVSLLYGRPWWKELRLPGEFWMMDTGGGCCVYDESTRWKSTKGHVLSFLLAGQHALLQVSANQSDRQIVEDLLASLPSCLADRAEEVLEAQVDRYVGSLNAMPGGWPAEELIGERTPTQGHPGVFLCGDYFFDSTLNAALVSAGTATDLCCTFLKAPARWSRLGEMLAPEGKTI